MPAAFRHVFRTLLRRPGLALLLVLTMALAVGATTSIFSVLDAVLLKPVPYSHARELAELWNRDPDGIMYPRLEPDRAHNVIGRRDLLAGVEQYADRQVLLGGVNQPAEVRASLVTAGLLPMLGVRPAEGRGILPEDTLPGAPPVALVSDAFRRQYLQGRGLGDSTRIRLDDRVYSVIGIMPAWFRYPRGIVSVWLPLQPQAPERQRVNYLVRFRPGITQAAASAALVAIGAGLDREQPRRDGWGMAPMFLTASHVNPDVRSSLWLLAAAVGCVLLVACANAANLLLVQATARHRELVIRSALGASRLRLVRQILAETLGFAVLGALGGVGLTYFLVGALPGLMPDELALFSDAPVTVDHRVLLFGLGVTILTWAACGIGPALYASRRRGPLAGGVTRGGTVSPAARRARNGLVVLQLALSLVLLAVTGLFLRSFVRLSRVDPGFDIGHVLTADIAIPAIRFPTPQARARLLERIHERLTGMPGIRSVAVATGLPPQSGITFPSGLETEAGPAGGAAGRVIPFAEVDSGFFATMGIPIELGRGFGASDTRDSAFVVMVSATMARTLWPAGSPVGRRFRMGPDSPWLTVVGVVPDVKLMGADDRRYPFALFYPRPPQGRATRQLSLAIRTAGPPESYAPAVQQALHEVYRDLPIHTIESARDRFAEGNEKPRFILLLLTGFATVAVTLALVGVYGVTAYTVLQRSREIGIRMALGAAPGDVLRFFLREGLALAAGGAALGLVGFLATSRLVRALLFGVGPRDPLVLAGAVLLLALAVVLGVLAPARRASRVNPAVAMAPE